MPFFPHSHFTSVRRRLLHTGGGQIPHEETTQPALWAAKASRLAMIWLGRRGPGAGSSTGSRAGGSGHHHVLNTSPRFGLTQIWPKEGVLPPKRTAALTPPHRLAGGTFPSQNHGLNHGLPSMGLQGCQRQQVIPGKKNTFFGQHEDFHAPTERLTYRVTKR